jgi:hypothetical protein
VQLTSGVDVWVRPIAAGDDRQLCKNPLPHDIDIVPKQSRMWLHTARVTKEEGDKQDELQDPQGDEQPNMYLSREQQ